MAGENDERRAAQEANRLLGQIQQTVRAAVRAGWDLPKEVTGAISTLDLWVRRMVDRRRPGGHDDTG